MAWVVWVTAGALLLEMEWVARAPPVLHASRNPDEWWSVGSGLRFYLLIHSPTLAHNNNNVVATTTTFFSFSSWAE